MLRSRKKKQAIKPLSFAWALLVGLLSIAAQVIVFYIRFGFFNTQASFANYVAFFLAGALGGLIFIYFLNREDSLRARRIVWAAFLLATPFVLLLMLAGGFFGPLGLLFAPQIAWALLIWLGTVLSRRG
jgi:hypothetical protein